MQYKHAQPFLLLGLCLCIILAGGNSRAAEPVSTADILGLLGASNSQLIFHGTFVHVVDNETRTFDIKREWSDDNHFSDTIVPLEGKPDPIKRKIEDGLNDCRKSSDNNSFVYNHHTGFPFIFSGNSASLNAFYDVSVGTKVRLADHYAWPVYFNSRDDFRYNYVLWVEESSGLLLKYQLSTPKGEILEQYMFTHVYIDSVADQSSQDVENETAVSKCMTAMMTNASYQPYEFNEIDIPQGYMTVRHPDLSADYSDSETSRHFLFSDGISYFSLFIQPLSTDKQIVDSVSQMGALTIAGKISENRQITLVGPVPVKGAINLLSRFP